MNKNLIYRAISAGILRALGEGERKNRFEISFSSETPCMGVNGWEILSHDADAVDLSRLSSMGVLIYHHGGDANFGRLPLGKIENVRLDEENRRCLAEIVFDEDDENAMKIARKVEKGIIKGISVGAMPTEPPKALREGEISGNGRFKGECLVYEKWEPFEISIEPIPADTSVGIGRSLTHENKNISLEEKNMTEEEKKALEEEEKKKAAAASQEEIKKALQRERERVSSIIERCGKFKVSPDEYIAGGLSKEQVSEAILKSLEEKSPKIGGSIIVTKDEGDKFRSAATDSIILRSAAVKLNTPSEGAKEMRSMTLRALAVECLQRSGVRGANTLGNEELFRSALSPASGFGGILSDSVNKTMGIAHAAAPSTYRAWTSKGSNSDFKPRKIFNISEAGDLSEIAENGEFQVDHMGDTNVTSILATFGKSFGFTRKAFINDDLDMLTKVPAAYVRAADRGINKAVYRLLRDNPTTVDGNKLFSAEHKNLSSGGKPSILSYQEALGSMMHQRSLRGIEALNIKPAFVICDPLQFSEHAALLNSSANPEGPNSGAFNPFNGMMQLIMDADLLDTVNGALPYYFAASPADCGTIEVSYLNGNEAPTLETKIDNFDYLGIMFRIYHDYGVTLIDHRGLYKNPGAVK